MRATFYVINAPLGRETVTVRAYATRGGDLLAERTFSTHAEAETWRYEQKCWGAEDAEGRAVCEGPDVRLVRAVSPDGTLFVTHWCQECRAIAEVDGYKVLILPPHTIVYDGEG